MPIAFSCPHCGKSTSVADQFAGQSGPCAACGRTITIPVSSIKGSYGSAAGSSGGAGAVIGVIAALIGIVVLGVAACAGIAFFAVRGGMQQAQTAARQMGSTNNLKQILIAIHSYHDQYGELPPAIVKDGNGKPLYSGFVLLLPYLEQPQLQRQFDLSKAWDAPENQPISMLDLRIFKNPNAPSSIPGKSDYLFVGGPQSLLGADGKRRLSDCLDGTSNTIVLVEVKGNAHSWAEPVVWTPDQLFDSDTQNGVVVGFADGSVRTMPKATPMQQLRLLADPKDGTPVSIP